MYSSYLHHSTQNFRGLYQGSFIVQTLGEHFHAIDGALDIPGVKERNAKPCGALALSIAAVCSHTSTGKLLIMLVG
jgi:hypothetical protein